MPIQIQHLIGNWEYCGWECHFTGISAGGIAVYVADKVGFKTLGATTPEYLETSIRFAEEHKNDSKTAKTTSLV